MAMPEAFAFAVVVSTGAYFIALGLVSLVDPARARRFLLGFAGSPLAHYLEMTVRALVGGSLLALAPRMLFPALFQAFGWILLVTTACLVLVPWRWHQRFSRTAVPRALPYIGAIGLASLLLGGLILGAVFLGRTA